MIEVCGMEVLNKQKRITSQKMRFGAKRSNTTARMSLGRTVEGSKGSAVAVPERQGSLKREG
jgi:hypothetical protein